MKYFGLFLVLGCLFLFSNLTASAAVPTPQIIVYGKQSCGTTVGYMNQLKQARIPFVFQDINEPSANKRMSAAMKSAGFTGNTIYMPVIEMNGKAYVRPDLSLVIGTYRKAMQSQTTQAPQ